jgi:8-oxo-dGTP pyrophosphatase MutT (NUDIX family)
VAFFCIKTYNKEKPRGGDDMGTLEENGKDCLVNIDRKNYVVSGSKRQRISIRGVIKYHGKYAMIHSNMFGEYRFPGGKMDPGETKEDTLIREVKEEVGLFVKSETISYLGYAKEVRKGRDEDIFEWVSYYFLCEVDDEKKIEPKLDAYEQRYGFKLAEVTLEEALKNNEKINLEIDMAGVERDTMVLRKIVSLCK